MTSPNPSWQAHGTSWETWNDADDDDDNGWLWGVEELGVGLGEEMKLHDVEDCVTRSGTMRQRREYGTGPDAKRTAQYRHYRVDQSPVLQEVKCNCRCDKVFLMRLITAVLNDCSVNSQPPKPTRSEKRCRGGLVHWLDSHRGLVSEFLASHPHFS
jgi:hypothetical protein